MRGAPQKRAACHHAPREKVDVCSRVWPFSIGRLKTEGWVPWNTEEDLNVASRGSNVPDHPWPLYQPTVHNMPSFDEADLKYNASRTHHLPSLAAGSSGAAMRYAGKLT